MPDSTASLSLRIVSSLPRNSFRLCLIILYKLKVKLPMSSLWHYGEADTLIQSEISQLSEEFFEVFQSLCLVSPKLLKVSLQTFWLSLDAQSILCLVALVLSHEAIMCISIRFLLMETYSWQYIETQTAGGFLFLNQSWHLYWVRNQDLLFLKTDLDTEIYFKTASWLELGEETVIVKVYLVKLIFKEIKTYPYLNRVYM